MREARVMAAVASDIATLRPRVSVPRPIAGLCSRRLLAMEYLDGTPLIQLAEKARNFT